jgi:hypothetical protein
MTKEVFIQALKNRNTLVLKEFAKLIAISIRNGMEDFHVNNLSDSQMKELNPLVRNSIYDFLISLAHSDRNSHCAKLLEWSATIIPPYWEDPEMEESLQKIVNKATEEKCLTFESRFLNEQFALRNIIYNPITGGVEIIGSYDFKEVAGNKHKHRDKISAALRKEGYYYNSGLLGYNK